VLLDAGDGGLDGLVHPDVTDTAAPTRTTAPTRPRPWNAESARTSALLPVIPATVFSASATRRFAPRGEPHEPLRIRWATTTGAASVVVTVANSALSSLTPE
jgi:hypothetical protein